jgi:hypothetical protein
LQRNSNGIRRLKLNESRGQTMRTGNANVLNQAHLSPHPFGRLARLLSNCQVSRPGGQDCHAAALCFDVWRCNGGIDSKRLSNGVVSALWKFHGQCAGNIGRDARRQDWLASFQQAPEYLRKRFDRFSVGINRFGITAPPLPVEIELHVAQVGS